jgi:hypothetical protein
MLLTVDMMIPPLSPMMVNLKVSKNDRWLLFCTYCPLSFFLSKHIMDSGIPEDVRIDESHYLLAKALDGAEGRKVIQDASTEKGRISHQGNGILGDPWKIRLPFKVEREILGIEIKGFGNEDTRMSKLGQGFFILSVDLEDVIKPKKLVAQRVKMKYLFIFPAE